MGIRIKYSILFLLVFLVPAAVWAVNITVPSAPGYGYGLTSTSTGAYVASSTGQVTCTGTVSCATADYVFGPNLTITGTGSGGGSGNVATSSAETTNDVPFWTSTNGTPATLSGGVSGFTWIPSTVTLNATEASTTNISASGNAYVSGSLIFPSFGTITATMSGIQSTASSKSIFQDASEFYTSGSLTLGRLANPWTTLFATEASTTDSLSVNATSTNATTTSLYVLGVKSALHLGDTNGQTTAYAGSSNPCSANQAPTTLSAVGALGGCTSSFLTTAVTSVASNNGITGGAITTTGTLSLISYLATSSLETNGRVPFWTTTSGNPAQLSGGSSAFSFSSAGNTLLTATNASTTNATAANIWDSALTSGDCVQASTAGILSNAAGACGTGTVTSIAFGTGLNGGTITTSGSVQLKNFLSTSSAETSGDVPFYTSTNGTPAAFSGGVAGFTFNSTGTLLTVTNASSSAVTTNYLNVNNSNATTTITGNEIVASTSPNTFVVKDGFGTQQIVDSTASTTGNVFQVSATTTGQANFGVDQFGHITASSTGATPTISSCGTGSPAMNANANDEAGSFTLGTSASSCTVTFAHPYTTTPIVVISDSNTTAVSDVSAVSTTAFTISLASGLSGAIVYYIVIQL